MDKEFDIEYDERSKLLDQKEIKIDITLDEPNVKSKSMNYSNASNSMYSMLQSENDEEDLVSAESSSFDETSEQFYSFM